MPDPPDNYLIIIIVSKSLENKAPQGKNNIDNNAISAGKYTVKTPDTVETEDSKFNRSQN